MKKFVVCSFILAMIFTVANAVVGSRITTDPQDGLTIQYGEVEPQPISRIGELWQASDPAAICGSLGIGTNGEYVAAGWYLNNIRMSMYQDSSTPEWEYVFDDPGFEYPLDMTPEGYTVLGAGSMLYGFNPGSSTPVMSYEIAGSTINNVAVSADGSMAYCTAVFSDHADIVAISEQMTEWSVTLDGGAGTLTLSGDGQTLVFTQYGGDNSNMIVLNAADGSVLFTDVEYNQNPPAISYDGSIIVNGDYSGYVHVYERTDDTYQEIWSYHVNSGDSGSSSWIGGMAVSADGETIAVGTLIFNSSGYDGEVYVFDTDIPEPLWIYDNCGDYVCSVDISDDGSLIAAGGYGPTDHSLPDFYLFRKGSSEPLYTINTPGSIFHVKLAGEGGMCATGGKAVHARLMGSGGTLYRVDAQPDGGTLTGTVTLDGYDDHSGVLIEIDGIDNFQVYTDENGDYEIPYIPANTYMVTASKTGFQSVTEAASIVEDDTTDLDFTLLPNGDPPTDLIASHGYDSWVRLDWTAPEIREIQQFNVYRKDYLTATFPLEPLGSVGGEELTYNDHSAVPLKKYYYVVTAVIDDLETPYSNRVIGWSSTSYITNQIDAYVGSTPVIDGTISADEWADAFALQCGDFLGTNDNEIDAMTSVLAFFKVDSAIENLYVAVHNTNDFELEDHDEVGLYFDDNNDGSFPANGSEDLSEGNFWAVHYASGNVIRYRPCFSPSGVGTTEEYADWEVAISLTDSGIIYEFAIPIGDQYNYIQPDDNNISGLGLFVLDDPSSFNAWWPFEMQNIFKPQYFGTIHFGAENEVPPPAENLSITGADGDVILSWELPEINDFGYMMVYMSDGEEETYLGNSQGMQYYHTLEEPGTYEFYVVTRDYSGQESEPSDPVQYTYAESAGEPDSPAFTGLNNIYPNPFNPTATVAFSLKQPENTRIDVYNIRGQRVTTLVNGKLPSGNHHVTWQGVDSNDKKVASGVYLIRFEAGETNQVRKALMLK